MRSSLMSDRCVWVPLSLTGRVMEAPSYTSVSALQGDFRILQQCKPHIIFVGEPELRFSEVCLWLLESLYVPPILFDSTLQPRWSLFCYACTLLPLPPPPLHLFEDYPPDFPCFCWVFSLSSHFCHHLFQLHLCYPWATWGCVWYVKWHPLNSPV